MPNLILHHYPMSPFAEKIRLVLGFKKLTWKSVIIPTVMPKPDVVALTGGYRKTPILQIGNDVYCDTALICDVLEHLQPEPTLYPPHQKGIARILAQWADDKLFPVAMAWNFSPAGAAQVFKDVPPEVAMAFAQDRSKMRSGQPRMQAADSAATYRSYLRRLSNMLDEHDFLLGNAPCVADFSAYHPLWFTRTIATVNAGILDATPSVLAWMDRMTALGHGAVENYSATRSIADCSQSTGANSLNDSIFQDEHGLALGSRVSIVAESFGPEATEGELVAATRTRYTLRRTDERAGVVHVHFPRIGYVLKAAQPA